MNYLIKGLISGFIPFSLVACEPAKPTQEQAKPTRQLLAFSCTLEKDHNPPLDPEADKYFQEARVLEKTNGREDWPRILTLYNKAIEKDHWKAMHNLVLFYTKRVVSQEYQLWVKF